MRTLIFFFIAAALLIVGIWMIAVPEEKIKEFIEGGISKSDLHTEVNGLKKGLFYNLNIGSLTLKGKGGDLLLIKDIKGKINPLYFFLLRLESSFNGKIQNGIISGRFGGGKNKRLVHIGINNVDIKDIPLFERIGFKGTGTLQAKFKMEDNRGNVKFDIGSANLETFTLSGISLPMNMFDRAKGMISINNNTVNIDSFSLEGTGIYGRIKGKIKDGIADLSLEIMPDASAGEKIPVLAFLERYKVYPGYYFIPIKTNLSF
ncbi:MAG: type II secretion system protein GspN [Nitrospirae bacterium]|nr:type II secretion system protein GspN [Nitrospirota bacterium]